jgi:hypothetical protein
MRAVLAALVIAVVATPAFAQQQHMQQYGEPDKDKTNSDKAAEKAAAEAYQRSLGAIPDQGKSDPWGTVRSNDTPKSAPAKTAKSKATKTGSAEPKAQ